MDLVIPLLKLAGVLLIVLLNGFFVAAEFAIVKVRSTQIEALERTGARKAGTARLVISHLDRYLSATQLGITCTSLAVGWAGEPFVAGLIESLCRLAGLGSQSVSETLSFAVGFTLITFATIVLGELTPRWLAIQRAEKTTLAVSRPLHLFYTVFRPFIWLLNRSAMFVIALLGVAPPGEAQIAHSEEELRLILSREKTFSRTSRSILLNALELQNRTVRQVMVPRTGVVYLSTSKSLEANVAYALENQFTRYPLCDPDLDNILGMIHIKDLFRLRGEGEHGQLLSIKREMLFVPETMPLERILNTFLTRRMLMAIAVDEYGSTAGLVTLENVLEELVGDIRDEFDVEALPVQKVNDAEYLVDGTMPLHDFARMFEVKPETKEVVTVSGYAIQLLGRVPEKGATLKIGQWSGTVEAVGGKRIKTLRIRRMPAGQQEKQGESSVEWTSR